MSVTSVGEEGWQSLCRVEHGKKRASGQDRVDAQGGVLEHETVG